MNRYEKLADVKHPLLVVVLDANDHSFGTFCTARQLRPRSEFVGTGTYSPVGWAIDVQF